MGGCTSASNWTENQDSVVTAALTSRQIQIVQDTWEMIISNDSAVWLSHLSRRLESDKELPQVFSRVDELSVLPSCSCPDNDFDGEELNDDVNTSSMCDGTVTEVPPGVEYCRALQKHGQFITETLGAAVESIDLEDASVFTNILVALGQIHCTYRVKPHYLPLFWPMIQHSLRQTLGAELFTDEVDQAWKAVFAYVISKMRDGIRTQQQQQQFGPGAALSSASYTSIIYDT